MNYSQSQSHVSAIESSLFDWTKKSVSSIKVMACLCEVQSSGGRETITINDPNGLRCCIVR